jgi:hypothetical protein
VWASEMLSLVRGNGQSRLSRVPFTIIRADYPLPFPSGLVLGDRPITPAYLQLHRVSENAALFLGRSIMDLR